MAGSDCPVVPEEVLSAVRMRHVEYSYICTRMDVPECIPVVSYAYDILTFESQNYVLCYSRFADNVIYYNYACKDHYNPIVNECDYSVYARLRLQLLAYVTPEDLVSVLIRLFNEYSRALSFVYFFSTEQSRVQICFYDRYYFIRRASELSMLDRSYLSSFSEITYMLSNGGLNNSLSGRYVTVKNERCCVCLENDLERINGLEMQQICSKHHYACQNCFDDFVISDNFNHKCPVCREHIDPLTFVDPLPDHNFFTSEVSNYMLETRQINDASRIPILGNHLFKIDLFSERSDAENQKTEQRTGYLVERMNTGAFFNVYIDGRVKWTLSPATLTERIVNSTGASALSESFVLFLIKRSTNEELVAIFKTWLELLRVWARQLVVKSYVLKHYNNVYHLNKMEGLTAGSPTLYLVQDYSSVCVVFSSIYSRFSSLDGYISDFAGSMPTSYVVSDHWAYLVPNEVCSCMWIDAAEIESNDWGCSTYLNASHLRLACCRRDLMKVTMFCAAMRSLSTKADFGHVFDVLNSIVEMS